MNNRWLTSEKLLIIGHRGASADAPENTLKAFKLAQEQGADGIEFDVRIASDGELVVIHDKTVDRTTNGSGVVNTFSSAELQTLDAGDGEPIPTLDQVFETCGPDFLYNVEIKDYGETDLGTEAAIATCIARHNIGSQVIVSSFDPNAVRRAQAILQKPTALGMLRAKAADPFPEWFEGSAEHPHFLMVNPAYIQWARERNYRIHVWTVDDPSVARLLADWQVDALMTNTPRKIRDMLADES